MEYNFFLRASKADVEREADIKDWQILLGGDDVDDLLGYINISMKDKKNDLWNWKHVEVVSSEEVRQHAYFFQHEWLPEFCWFRLFPVYEKIEKYVKPSATPEKVITKEQLAAFEKLVGVQAAE